MSTPRPRRCPRLARQTLGLPLQRNNPQLKRQRGVRVPALLQELTAAGLPR